VLPETIYFFISGWQPSGARASLRFIGEKNLNPRLLDNRTEKITILTDSVPSFHVQPVILF
jgi:hypothetical protein